VVKTKSKVMDTNKKFKNQDLPCEIDCQVWHHVFVLTFMVHVAQQDNPFKHNIKVGCAVMQKIWDEVFGETPHRIVQSSPMYQLIHIDFEFISLQKYLCCRPCNMFLTHGAAPWAQQ